MAKLLRMTDKQLRRARALILRLCANLDKDKNKFYCLPLDNAFEQCPCPQLTAYSVICKYFRTAVLPVDVELNNELNQTKSGKRCQVCGKPIYSSSNFAKYCPECSVKVRKQKEAKRKRERYSSLRK